MSDVSDEIGTSMWLYVASAAAIAATIAYMYYMQPEPIGRMTIPAKKSPVNTKKQPKPTLKKDLELEKRSLEKKNSEKKNSKKKGLDKEGEEKERKGKRQSQVEKPLARVHTHTRP